MLFLVVLGMVAMLAGIVAFVLGNWVLGLVLLLGGLACMAISYTTMMRGRSEDPNQGTFNGVAGQGKQQSETVKVNMPEPGEQNPDVWEKMEK